MTILAPGIKSAVAAGALSLMLCPAWAQQEDLDDLFEALRAAEAGTAKAIEERIWAEWSKSGSPAMDLLLERGQAALEAEDMPAAIEHLTALIDHAPDFAEAYHSRATAYFKIGLYGPALADIRQALALNPRHFGALSGLALILEEIGKKDGALEAYRAVEEIYPAREGLKTRIDILTREVEGESL